jgi:NAD(P)-dependent dehydrogenase (short-subunit alcohol dehydrogenase family)
VPHATENPVLLNITNGIAHIPTISGVSSYAVSKIANAKVVECAGDEIEGLNVVNVQPGMLETDLNNLVSGLDSRKSQS